MHNKYATFVLPVLAGLAIVGAGFSTWVFGENTSDAAATATGSITITDADDAFNATIELGTASKSSDGIGTFDQFVTDPSECKFTLQLDQGGKENASEKTIGISVVSGLESYDIKWKTEKTNFKTLYDGYYLNLEYTVLVTYNGNTDTYLNWTGTATGETRVAVASLTDDGDGFSTIWGATGINNTWSYDLKPQDFGEYSTMVSALTDASNTVELEVTVTASLSK